VRLREKGGKRHAMPCHHNLEEYLTAYLDGAGLRGDPKGPLFPTIGRGTGKLTRHGAAAGERLCDAGLRDRALIGLMVYSFAPDRRRTRDDGRRCLYTEPAPLGATARQANAYAMIRRRAAAAGIATKLGNHSFRATGITAYLKNGGTLEKAAAMANHASTRTTQLYDRRCDELSLDEVERIVI
jgi:integrase